MTKRRVAAPSSLIRSLTRHPALPALMRELPPHDAARLIQRVGVMDATELMVAMPATALLRTLDESVWKQPAPGAAEQVDADELVEWFEAWLDIGETFLLERLAAMADDYLVLLLARVVAVDSTNRYAEADDAFEAVAAQCHDDAERFGPFVVTTLHAAHREVLRLVLDALWIEDRERLWRILNRLDAMPEDEGGRRGWTATALDVEAERNAFRAGIGFVSADDARALLAGAEASTAHEILALAEYDPLTARLLGGGEVQAAAHPIAAEDVEAEAQGSSTAGALVASEASAGELESLRAMLEAAELIDTHAPLRLLAQTGESGEPPLTTLLRSLAAEDPPGFERAMRELAYLANILRVGVTLDARALTNTEAREAAFATCAIGVELARARAGRNLAREPGLIRYFMLGWRALAALRDHVAPAFEAAFERMAASWLRDEVESGLRDLRAALAKRAFAEARECVIFLSIAFDSGACQAITRLLDVIPRDGASRWITSTRDLDRIATILDELVP
jgi:hypothetical protein